MTSREIVSGVRDVEALNGEDASPQARKLPPERVAKGGGGRKTLTQFHSYFCLSVLAFNFNINLKIFFLDNLLLLNLLDTAASKSAHTIFGKFVS